jgi:hypothetical protein
MPTTICSLSLIIAEMRDTHYGSAPRVAAISPLESTSNVLDEKNYFKN